MSQAHCLKLTFLAEVRLHTVLRPVPGADWLEAVLCRWVGILVAVLNPKHFFVALQVDERDLVWERAADVAGRALLECVCVFLRKAAGNWNKRVKFSSVSQNGIVFKMRMNKKMLFGKYYLAFCDPSFHLAPNWRYKKIIFRWSALGKNTCYFLNIQ